MDNGYYPITNMEEDSYDNGAGTIDVDPRSGYTETGSQKFVNPFFSTIPKNMKAKDAIETIPPYPLAETGVSPTFQLRPPHCTVNMFSGELRSTAAL